MNISSTNNYSITKLDDTPITRNIHQKEPNVLIKLGSEQLKSRIPQRRRKIVSRYSASSIREEVKKSKSKEDYQRQIGVKASVQEKIGKDTDNSQKSPKTVTHRQRESKYISYRRRVVPASQKSREKSPSESRELLRNDSSDFSANSSELCSSVDGPRSESRLSKKFYTTKKKQGDGTSGNIKFSSGE